MAAGGAGLAVAVAAMVAAAALMMPPLVAGTYAECYDYCFKDCISKDKSMRDYCSYACDKTCAPDAAARRRPVPAPGGGGLAMACQIDCARASCHGLRPDGKDDMTDCYEQCYDKCHTGTDLPRPLRTGKLGGDARPAAALQDQPSDEKQDGVGPAASPGQPFQEKQDGVSNEAWRPVRP